MEPAHVPGLSLRKHGLHLVLNETRSLALSAFQCLHQHPGSLQPSLSLLKGIYCEDILVWGKWSVVFHAFEILYVFLFRSKNVRWFDSSSLLSACFTSAVIDSKGMWVEIILLFFFFFLTIFQLNQDHYSQFNMTARFVESLQLNLSITPSVFPFGQASLS